MATPATEPTEMTKKKGHEKVSEIISHWSKVYIN